MQRTEHQERRLDVLARYQEYVEALRESRLDAQTSRVIEARRALARALEVACRHDPALLTDFKKAFASHYRT